MRLRNRAKEKSVPMREENEEDVDDPDDPEDDSDCDPEWEVPEEKSDQSFSSKKRKAFTAIPLQMQNSSKVVIIGGESSKQRKIETPSSSAGSSGTLKSTPSTSKIPELSNKSSPQTNQSNNNDLTQNHQKVIIMSSNKNKEIMSSPNVTKISPPLDNASVNNGGSRMVVSKSTPPIKVVHYQPRTGYTSSPHSFVGGDFIKDITKKDCDCIWLLDGMNLLRKFPAFKDSQTGETRYKSSDVYDGLNAMNKSKFQKVNVNVTSKTKNVSVVRLADVDPLQMKIKVEPVETPPPPSSTPPAAPPKAVQVISAKENANLTYYKNTFKDDIAVFLQALISNCLDKSFLSSIYNDNDEYFMEKMKLIDDVLDAKKDSLKGLRSFTKNMRILNVIHTYPFIEEKQLPAVKMEKFYCLICAQPGNRTYVISNVCLELTGTPYEVNTLNPVPPHVIDVDEDLKVLLSCHSCSKLMRLYSKMCHTKYLIFKQCEKAVQKILEAQETKIEGSDVIVKLLSNESWCEARLMQMVKDWVAVDDMRRVAQ